MVLVLFALPETSRVIVGNDSGKATGVHRTLLSALIPTRNIFSGSRDAVPRPASGSSTHTPTPPSPLACLKLLLVKDVALVILCNGIYYIMYCCIQASLSTLFIEVYGYGTLEAGLIYIPFGLGCLVSTLLWGSSVLLLTLDPSRLLPSAGINTSSTGRFLDFSYTRTARHHGIPIDRERQGNLDEFPIRQARLKGTLYLVIVSTVATVGYG